MGDILLLYSHTYAWRKVKCVPLIYFYNLIKFNIVTCMKVTEETFSFHHERKGAEEARYQKY